MTSIGAMLQKISGLRGTKDVNDWEDQFIASCLAKFQRTNSTSELSSKQVEIIERIHNKHFA